jgi:putative transposase
MPRPPRADEAGGIYHALNRGNARQRIFQHDSDFAAFERIIADALINYPVELFSYQWMPNHWHMVLRSLEDGAMSRMLHWATMTHSARRHAHRGTTGEGHLYQGRFKSFPVQDDDHFHIVCRYVERNALVAGLVRRAEDWRWGSLWNWCGGDSSIRLASWPIARLPGWVEYVNQPLRETDVARLQHSIRRGSPFGDDDWVKVEAQRLHLEASLRARGRPRRFA